MAKKNLDDIKYGVNVIKALQTHKKYFVNDIKRATGLEQKALVKVLQTLLKNEYLEKNDKGQWYVPVSLDNPGPRGFESIGI